MRSGREAGALTARSREAALAAYANSEESTGPPAFS
jgi:hypothetical protein